MPGLVLEARVLFNRDRVAWGSRGGQLVLGFATSGLLLLTQKSVADETLFIRRADQCSRLGNDGVLVTQRRASYSSGSFSPLCNRSLLSTLSIRRDRGGGVSGTG